MRDSEWIQAGFAALLALAGWLRPLSPHRRYVVTLLAVVALLAIALARLSAFAIGSEASNILRDWLPVPLTLIPYWQTGQFFLGPHEEKQALLVRIDAWLLRFVPRTRWTSARPVRLTMEWAYMLCYPLVPMGLGALYIAGLRQDADFYWFFVLIPTYICYAVTPFVPALPPRSLGKERDARPSNRSRVFNLWILKHGSIQAISFPSAHVASALAVSLVLLHFAPIAGIVFLVISFWIAVAAVAGGYHYASDVVLGAVTTLAVFAAWWAHLIPNTLFTAPAMSFAAPL